VKLNEIATSLYAAADYITQYKRLPPHTTFTAYISTDAGNVEQVPHIRTCLDLLPPDAEQSFIDVELRLIEVDAPGGKAVWPCGYIHEER
jgi:hypothetical protein